MNLHSIASGKRGWRWGLIPSALFWISTWCLSAVAGWSHWQLGALGWRGVWVQPLLGASAWLFLLAAAFWPVAQLPRDTRRAIARSGKVFAVWGATCLPLASLAYWRGDFEDAGQIVDTAVILGVVAWLGVVSFLRTGRLRDFVVLTGGLSILFLWGVGDRLGAFTTYVTVWSDSKLHYLVTDCGAAFAFAFALRWTRREMAGIAGAAAVGMLTYFLWDGRGSALSSTVLLGLGSIAGAGIVGAGGFRLIPGARLAIAVLATGAASLGLATLYASEVATLPVRLMAQAFWIALVCFLHHIAGAREWTNLFRPKSASLFQR